MKSNPKGELIHYFKSNWKVMLLLLLVAIFFLAVACSSAINAEYKDILYSLFAGVISSLIYSSMTDFNNKKFYMDVLDDHQMSFHLGGRMHADHRGLLSRKGAIDQYLKRDETLKILTLTADDYLKNEQVLDSLKGKLRKGSFVKILLYAPVYNLRSYVDKEVENPGIGQRHLKAVDLIREQISLIPTIKSIKEEFGEKFEIRFYTVDLHQNMIIYGSQRIYSAPIMRNTRGVDLPCLEFFQGVNNNELYNKFSSEFDYIWERPSLYLVLDEVVALYDKVQSKIPLEITNYEVDIDVVSEVEVLALNYQQKRVGKHYLGPERSLNN